MKIPYYLKGWRMQETEVVDKIGKHFMLNTPSL